MTACFPCACPPFSHPVPRRLNACPPVALPAAWPRYVIPCSHLLDAPYSLSLNPGYPFPRQPRPFESETRAGGTGLIWGPSRQPCSPCSPPATWPWRR